MKNRFFILTALLLAAFMLCAACSDQKPAEDANNVNTDPVQDETPAPVRLGPIQIKVHPIKEVDTDIEYPKTEEGLAVQYIKADTDLEDVKLETFELTVPMISETGTEFSTSFTGGKLTRGENVYPFVLTPKEGVPTVDFAVVIDEEPYSNYFFVQASTGEIPYSCIYTYSYDSDLPVAVTYGNLNYIGKGSVKIANNVAFFGTWLAVREYTFTPGEPNTVSPCFTPVPDSLYINGALEDADMSEVWRNFVTREFEVNLRGADGTYSGGTLAVGTKFVVTRSDGEHTIYFKTVDGQEGYFDNYQYNADAFFENDRTVGGLSESDIIGYTQFGAEDDVYPGPYYYDGWILMSQIKNPKTTSDYSYSDVLTDERMVEVRALEGYKD